MKPSLIDTDILSEFLKGRQIVVDKFNEYIIYIGPINISVITYYEILIGLLYRDAKNKLRRFDSFAKLCNIIPLTRPMASKVDTIQAELLKTGKIIGHTDTLIAGIALSNKLQLITNKTKHFSRIKGLKIDNWLHSK